VETVPARQDEFPPEKKEKQKTCFANSYSNINTVKMERIFFILFIVILLNKISFAQKWIPETICSTDTVLVEPYQAMKYNAAKPDSLTPAEPYKVVECKTRSNVGFRIDVAVSKYYYGEKTASWMGQHGGPNFNFIFTLNKWNLGFRFKPWTFSPKKEMEFNGHMLPTSAKVNTIKLDYYVGYSFDFEKLVSLEPYLGYNRTSLVVINEEDLNQTYKLYETGGFIAGATLNKYFKIKEYEYISVFASAGYAFVNYKKVHPDFDKGYFEWNFGVAYKGFLTRLFDRKVD